MWMVKLHLNYRNYYDIFVSSFVFIVAPSRVSSDDDESDEDENSTSRNGRGN